MNKYANKDMAAVKKVLVESSEIRVAAEGGHQGFQLENESCMLQCLLQSRCWRVLLFGVLAF